MRVLTAFMQRERLDAVLEALAKLGFKTVAVCDAAVYTTQKGGEAGVEATHMVKLELPLGDSPHDGQITSAIKRHAATSSGFNGWVRVLPCDEMFLVPVQAELPLVVESRQSAVVWSKPEDPGERIWYCNAVTGQIRTPAGPKLMFCNTVGLAKHFPKRGDPSSGYHVCPKCSSEDVFEDERWVCDKCEFPLDAEHSPEELLGQPCGECDKDGAKLVEKPPRVINYPPPK